MPLHLVIYGIDGTTGELRNIEDVSSGVACDCVCPKCGSVLEAHKGKVYRHHFQHHSVAECKGAFESQLHLLSKDIIEEDKSLMLPVYAGRYSYYPQRQQTFTEVVKECAQDDLQPDCLCKYTDEQGNEQMLWVEILYSHAVDEEKARKIQERKIACVEVDVSNLFKDAEVIDRNMLTDFLLNSPDNRKWINNTQGDEQVLAEADEIRRRESISEFLIQNSDDETRIWKFQTLAYCLFSTGYTLPQKDYLGLYGFVKKHQTDYGNLDPVIQQRFVSAVQMLLCHLVVMGKFNVRGFSKQKQLYALCIDRKGLTQTQQLQHWVNEAIRLGAGLHKSQRTATVSRSQQKYILQRGRWVRRRRF